MSGASRRRVPAEQHILRDLQLAVEHRPDGTSTAWMPVTSHICHDSGAARAGVLGILVDVVGGGLAAVAARPDWIATADLTLHLTPRPVTGEIEAHGRVLRQGRTTVVVEVALQEAAGTSLGFATMSFAVLPRGLRTSRSTRWIATDDDGHNGFGLAPRFTSAPTSRSSARNGPSAPAQRLRGEQPGAVQGGMKAAAADAAEQAVRRGRRARRPSTSRSPTKFAKVGPIRTRPAS